MFFLGRNFVSGLLCRPYTKKPKTFFSKKNLGFSSPEVDPHSWTWPNPTRPVDDPNPCPTLCWCRPTIIVH